jgi:hypothetical protein
MCNQWLENHATPAPLIRCSTRYQCGSQTALKQLKAELPDLPILMGGIRTAGDLVSWMQMTRKMKIHEAKAYVAAKLGVDVFELTD